MTKCGQFMGPKLRKKYADELAKYLPSMERYVTCITGNRFPESRMGSFLQSKKFYLAFENSLHCKGYITEKFYHSSLAHNTVPVVWGSRKEDYLQVAPPNSFIHAEDFSSPKELAEYLLYLDSNNTAYREYFRWRGDPKKSWDDVRNEANLKHPSFTIHPGSVRGIQPGNMMGLEPLCQKIAIDKKPKIIPSLRKVVYDEESEECQMR